MLLSTSLSETPDVASTSDPFTFKTSSVVLQRSVSLFCSAYAQTKLCKEIYELESKIVSLSHLKPIGFPTAQNMKQLNMARVSYLVSDTEKQKKHRTEKKSLLMQLADENESNTAKLFKFNHSSPGSSPIKNTKKFLKTFTT